MSDSKRVSRVEREIREIVAQFIISGLRVKPKGLVTVSRVWVSKDLRLARAYVTVLAGSEDPEDDVDVLRKNLPDMQRAIAKSIKTKFCPKLEIFFDETYEESMKVQTLIRQVEDERKSRESQNSDESGDKE